MPAVPSIICESVTAQKSNTSRRRELVCLTLSQTWPNIWISTALLSAGKKTHVTLFAWRLGGSLLCWPGTSRHERKRKTTSKQRAHSSSRPAACSQNNDRAQYFIWRRFLKCFRSFRVELMTVTTVWLNDNVLFNQQMGTLPITHSTFWTVIYSLNHSQKSTQIKGDLINAIKVIDHAVMCMNYIIFLDQMY